MPDSKPLIFFDSSVLFSAAKSHLGGSFRVLEECQNDTFKPVASRRVIQEVQTALKEKYPEVLLTFYNLLLNTNFKIVNPTIALIKKYQKIINPDDVVILAAALKARVDYLLTLDKKHFILNSQIAKKTKIKILTPQEFLNQMRKKKLVR